MADAVNSINSTTLSAMPGGDNGIVQFTVALHIPQFVGTFSAFLTMVWALKTRRIV